MVMIDESKKASNSRDFTINDLPVEERPRERLQRYGAGALSQQELISVILGRGIKGESVTVTSQRLIGAFGGAQGLGRATLQELSAIRGIGSAKACQLAAAFELARRQEETASPCSSIKKPEDAAAQVSALIRDKQKEHFLVLLLDSRNCPVKVSQVSVGSLNSSLVHPREVFKEAIGALSASVILAHNHPSGDPEPSGADLDITTKLVEAGKIIGIEVLDHIIVGRDRFYSFKERGLIK
jgi:DNA repair protein RadC